ncbi:B3 domain-containing protein REM10-like isoform X2 [Tasmannia lanceolata]|uniref:B3 domain-containing protein REM10-like isoform X2 n=1 Tax=Tasmannia lanceolata TaxID=3420 RepID=UPI004062F79A
MKDQQLSLGREMKEKSSHQPQFLKPIFPEYFQKISIPIAFHRYLVGEKSDIAVLKSALGKSWPVKVKGCINGVFFEEGWEDFVADHGLSSGDILLFRYEGNMVFDVTVFDKTACDRRYPPLVLKDDKKMQKQRERKDEKHVEALELGGQMVGFEGSSSYKPEAPHFVVTMRRSNVNHDYMGIPRKFVVANNLGKRTEITLEDPEGRSFPMTLFHKKPPHYSTSISTGWQRFAISNKLEEGDECIFDLVTEDVMNVRICRRAMLNNSVSSLLT